MHHPRNVAPSGTNISAFGAWEESTKLPYSNGTSTKSPSPSIDSWNLTFTSGAAHLAYKITSLDGILALFQSNSVPSTHSSEVYQPLNSKFIPTSDAFGLDGS